MYKIFRQRSVKHILYTKPRLNYDEWWWKSFIKIDKIRALRWNKQEQVTYISLITDRIKLLGRGITKYLKISPIGSTYKKRRSNNLQVCTLLLNKIPLALFSRFLITFGSINWFRHRRAKGQPPLGWPRFERSIMV